MPRISERDLELVRFAARVKLVTPTIVADRFGVHVVTAYRRLAVLNDTGFLDSSTQPAFGRVHYATRAGIANVGLDLHPGRFSLATLTHDVALAQVAATFERAGYPCLTERELRFHERNESDGRYIVEHQRDGRRIRHFPDLALEHPQADAFVALEVELSNKSRERRRAILKGYSHRVDVQGLAGVLYLAGGMCRPQQLSTLADDVALGDAFALAEFGSALPADQLRGLFARVARDVHSRRVVT